jgi:epoxyqueuosine reductase
MKLRSEQIKHQARALGFDKIGIVAATALTEEGARLNEWLARGFHGQMNYLARDPQQRADPRLFLPSAKSVVCVALNYFRPEKHSDDPATAKISRYAWGDDYHDVLRDKLKALLAWIHEREPGVEGKICVDSSPAMDKAWAVRAGLGWLGKHTNVITKEFGSWVFLGELLLSVELDYDSAIEPDHCGKCTACLDACPTGALIAPYQIDGTRCISYGTIELREPELPEPIQSAICTTGFSAATSARMSAPGRAFPKRHQRHALNRAPASSRHRCRNWPNSRRKNSQRAFAKIRSSGPSWRACKETRGRRCILQHQMTKSAKQAPDQLRALHLYQVSGSNPVELLNRLLQ